MKRRDSPATAAATAIGWIVDGIIIERASFPSHFPIFFSFQSFVSSITNRRTLEVDGERRRGRNERPRGKLLYTSDNQAGRCFESFPFFRYSLATKQGLKLHWTCLDKGISHDQCALTIIRGSRCTYYGYMHVKCSQDCATRH